MSSAFYVYILTNKHNTFLYTGVTNNLFRRVFEHKSKSIEGFTKKYNASKLVFYETFTTSLEAIAAEKRIKGWTRKKKGLLYQDKNPNWKDLSTEI